MCPRGPPAWGGCQFAGKAHERRKPPSRAEHSISNLKGCERRCRKMVNCKDLGSESLYPKPALPLATCGTFSTFQTWWWATQFLCQWRARWPSFWKFDQQTVSSHQPLWGLPQLQSHVTQSPPFWGGPMSHDWLKGSIETWSSHLNLRQLWKVSHSISRASHGLPEASDGLHQSSASPSVHSGPHPLLPWVLI